MYGLIGSFDAHPGQRDALIAAMTEGAQPMPGCLSYVVAKDPGNPDRLWITEVWTDEESHKASLQIAWVKAAIGTAMPLIAAFGTQQVTEPVSVA